MVFGMSNDKDVNVVLGLLPREAFYFFTEAKLPRAMPAGKLKERALDFGLRGGSGG